MRLDARGQIRPTLLVNALAATVAATVAIGGAGCKGEFQNGFAVDVQVKIDASIANPAAITRVHVDVSGAETASHDLPTPGGKLSSRSAGFIYRPTVTSGDLTFAVQAIDDAGGVIVGTGSTTATIKAGGTVTATVNVVVSGQPLPDLMTPPRDLGGADLSTVDLTPTPDLASDLGDLGDLPVPADLADLGGDLRDGATPTCTDGVKNGDETDVDCGGSCTTRCAQAKGCAANTDCATGLTCVQGQSAKLCSAVATCPLCMVTTGAACVAATAGSDPKAECTSDSMCKSDNCDGKGTCNAAVGTQCAAPACATTGGPAAVTSACDAAGVCQKTSKPCGAFTCAAGQCGNSCRTDAECVSSAYCDVPSTTCLLRPFTTAVATSTSPGPQMTALADFNRDGILDVAAPAFTTGNAVVVLFGRGDGTLAPGVVTGVTFAQPNWIVTGDVNLDGIPDMVVTSFGNGSGGYQVYLGNSTGAFGAQTAVGVSAGATTATLADLDRDGKPDLVVGTNLGVLAFRGNGNGTFTALALAGTGAAMIVPGLAVADVNRDGKPDIVAATSSAPRLVVWLGNGDGTFGNPVIYTGTVPYFRVALADLNDDGFLDAVALGANNGRVSVFMHGGTLFGTAVDTTVGTQPRGLALGDIDGDGRPDVVTSDAAANTVEVLYNRGDGTLRTAVTSALAAGGSPLDLSLGDLDRDGTLDVAVAKGGISTGTTVDVGIGTLPSLTLKLTQVVPPLVTAPSPWLGILADLNLDGKPDLFTTSDQVSKIGQTFIGKGDGTFSAATSRIVGTRPQQAAVADFDRDGLPDVAVLNTQDSTLTVLLGSGAATTTISVGASPVALAVADMNSDGILDVVVADAQQNVLVFQGRTGATFVLVNTTPIGATAGLVPTGVATGDLNRDGRPDVVVAGQFGAVMMVSVPGSTALNITGRLVTSAESRAPVVGDFNRDGRLDFAVTDRPLNRVSVVLGNGAGGISTAAPYPSIGASPFHLTSGDFNRDGIVDLAVATLGGVTLLTGKADGTFNAGVQMTAGSAPVWVSAEDINSDGRLDLAVTNQQSANTFVYLNTGQ